MRVSGVFSVPNDTVLRGWPPRGQGLPGLPVLGRAEVGALKTRLGKGKEMRGLPRGPSFPLRPGLTPFVNRFAF